jgi:hypothetical protein
MSTTQLIETNKLLIMLEKKLSKLLFLKRVTKRKVLILSLPEMLRPLMKLLLKRRMDSKLMTTKEEELLQQPETP